jgi:hypothetical protein
MLLPARSGYRVDVDVVTTTAFNQLIVKLTQGMNSPSMIRARLLATVPTDRSGNGQGHRRECVVEKLGDWFNRQEMQVTG